MKIEPVAGDGGAMSLPPGHDYSLPLRQHRRRRHDSRPRGRLGWGAYLIMICLAAWGVVLALAAGAGAAKLGSYIAGMIPSLLWIVVFATIADGCLRGLGVLT